MGRILGPKGLTLKRLEMETGCRIFVRGRGSMRNRQQELERLGKIGFEHLNEPLHILLETEAESCLQKARPIIQQILIPAEDDFKREQLKKLIQIRSGIKIFE